MTSGVGTSTVRHCMHEVRAQMTQTTATTTRPCGEQPLRDSFPPSSIPASSEMIERARVAVSEHHFDQLHVSASTLLDRVPSTMSLFKSASSRWRSVPFLTASALSLTIYTAHLRLRPALADDTFPRLTEGQPRPSQADVANLRSIPVCIITANPDEAESLQSKMKGTWARVRDVEILGVHGGLTFFTGQVMGKNGATHSAYITSCTRPGTQTFAIECSSLFRALQPQYAVHVGVCTVPNEK
jgi:hypothetical protein